MRRYFNMEGQCQPDIHYMVRLDERLVKIKRLYVDKGKYFIINRGRQDGSTTTLMELEEYLKDDYIVFMDFQDMSTAPFENEKIYYYMEAHTKDARRTDLIVDYVGEQFIIEMKIWHESEYNERGEEQLADYLNYYHPTGSKLDLDSLEKQGITDVFLNEPEAYLD